MEIFLLLSNLDTKFAKFPIFILQFSQLVMSDIGKWTQFSIVSLNFTI